MLAKPPTNLRETLEFLRFYRKEVGLQPLLDAAQGGEWSTRQIYFAVHGRPPDTLEAVLNVEGHEVHDLLQAALHSDEFRQRHAGNILRAFPDKHHLYFVHIPKSAGSDLASHLTSRYPTLNTRLSQTEWATPEEFLLSLKHFTLEVAQSDTIFVTGHNHLATYAEWGAMRLGDRVFTVLRDPVAQVLSQLNYVLTRIFSDESPPAPDTLGWRAEFGVTDPHTAPSRGLIQELTHRVLHHPGVVAENVACHYLGRGTYETALESVAIHDVELVDLSTYAAWSQQEWGIEHSRHVNESRKYISATDLSAPQMEYLVEHTREDSQLHARLLAALHESGGNAIVGAALARGGQAQQAVRLPPAAPPPSTPSWLDQPGPELPLNELMLKFESWGENCEFGLVQRRCGAEPLGLLRFASAPLPKLLKALNNRFEGMGRPENIEIQVSGNGREYMVLDKAYNFLYHAWVLVGEQSMEAVKQRECRRVPFLVRKLVEDLEAGQKVFVYHGMEEQKPHDAMDLTAALRRYGSSKLLWVELARENRPVGSVHLLAESLIRGFIDRFAPRENAHDLSLNTWTTLCRKTLTVAHQHDQ